MERLRLAILLVCLGPLSGPSCQEPATPNQAVFWVFTGELQTPLAVRPANVAHRLDRKWWEWTLYLEGHEEHLDRIGCVQYLLHPTYPEPLVEVCDRGEGPRAFSLTRSAWGTFLVRIRLFLKDGRDYRMAHFLRFAEK